MSPGEYIHLEWMISLFTINSIDDRRGAMVLFTAPEDMVIGQACNITEREAKSRPKYEMPEDIITRMKTTNALKQGALGYNVTKVLVCVWW